MMTNLEPIGQLLDRSKTAVFYDEAGDYFRLWLSPGLNTAHVRVQQQRAGDHAIDEVRFLGVGDRLAIRQDGHILFSIRLVSTSDAQAKVQITLGETLSLRLDNAHDADFPPIL